MLKYIPHVATPLIVSLVLGGCSAERRQQAAQGKIDFNRQIRPIFTQNCTGCHGGVKSASGVSFVYREGALRTGDSKKRTIVPGHPEQSEIIARITSTDPAYRMPKPDHGPPLSKEQIATIRQWISEGAEWSEHWAFVAPEPRPVPDVSDEAWAKSPIDRFVRARLDREKLTHSPEADRATLLRRLSFDLTGLPPTPDELATFIADNQPGAYERQVERLLASPHYGERWATLWLDLSRYADTRGYEKDSERSAWKFRDWLIDALNRNLPYDQFGIDMLAGDLIPGATLEQRIATTFNRNTQTNDEGGSDDEEFRIASVMDRVSTTWSVFNGVTFSCVQCHDHPYDPIRQEEYYRFLAFFNSTKDADYVSEYPNLRIPLDRAEYAEANSLHNEADKLIRTLAAQVQSLVKSTDWVAAAIANASASSGGRFQLKDGEAFSPATVPDKAMFNYWLDLSSVGASPITAIRMEVAPQNDGQARHTPEVGFVVNRVQAWLVRRDGTETPLPFSRLVADQMDPVESTFDSPRKADTPKGPPKRNSKQSPEKYSPLAGLFSAPGFLAKIQRPGPINAALPKPPPPLSEVSTLFGAYPSLDRTRWAVAIFQKPVTFSEGDRLRVRVSQNELIASRPAPVRRMRMSAATGSSWTEFGLARQFQAERDRLQEVRLKLAAIPGIDEPVMEDLPAAEARETRVFVRGNWMDKGDKALKSGVPHLFPPLPDGAPLNRLTLAKWFFSEKQPLTARAAVNRYWEQFFGIGIVETLEDYGSIGEPPSHPELLDWLARHFQFDLAWNVKALHREIVTSQTYRQSARVTPALFERDPRNRLLARGPRNRLSAEMVRDQALLASGMLSPKMFGEPVMPYQPPGVWASPYNGKDWKESKGGDAHRRAIYTFWKRTAAYPSFLSFDATSRDICTLRRVPTNTPLQALVTLNDPVYDEAAKALAHIMRKRIAGSSDIGAGVSEAWLRVTNRRPGDLEIGALVDLYNDARKFTAGEQDPDFSALTAVGSALLNLDAALTK